LDKEDNKNNSKLKRNTKKRKKFVTSERYVETNLKCKRVKRNTKIKELNRRLRGYEEVLK